MWIIYSQWAGALAEHQGAAAVPFTRWPHWLRQRWSSFSTSVLANLLSFKKKKERVEYEIGGRMFFILGRQLPLRRESQSGERSEMPSREMERKMSPYPLPAYFPPRHMAQGF